MPECLHERESVWPELESMPDEKTWRELSEVTPAQVALFNRRIVGELDRMTTHNYTSGMNASDDQIQEEVAETHEVASHHINVERRIRCVKEYQIFDGVLPLSLPDK